jgi:phosphate transport system permease protein
MHETMPTPTTAQGAAALRAPGGEGTLDLSGMRSRRTSERLVRAVLFLCGALSIVTTVAIVAVLILEAAEFFRMVPVWDYLTGADWRPNKRAARGEWGVLPLVSATLTYALIAMLIAVPIGLMTAIYLAEYAPAKIRAIGKPILELLAGIPTVVYGFFALTFITPELLQRVFSELNIYNVLSAGLAIGILTIPLVASLSEDALTAVPRSLREAAYAVGATKFETSVRVVFPAAISGIVASVILALGRAVGETMIIVIAGGAKVGDVPTDPLNGAQAMTSYIVNVLQGDTSRGDPRYFSLFAVGLTLLVITLLLNLVSRAFVARFREVYQ